ncbi:TolC family protein [Sphingomonas sp. MMS24-JH45]
MVNFAATTLSSLFAQGSRTETGSAAIDYPIFRAGAGRANVELSQAQRDALLAQYEGTIQTAFQEVSDALARRGTITAMELAARQRFLVAARDTYNLANLRYTGGVDTYLSSLDAQRQLFTAQQSVVETELIRATNLVTLYRTLGGDSQLEAGPRGPVLAAQQGAQQLRSTRGCAAGTLAA